MEFQFDAKKKTLFFRDDGFFLRSSSAEALVDGKTFSFSRFSPVRGRENFFTANCPRLATSISISPNWKGYLKITSSLKNISRGKIRINSFSPLVSDKKEGGIFDLGCIFKNIRMYIDSKGKRR